MARKLPPGIYLTPHGYRAVVNTANGRIEKRFKADTELQTIKDWRYDEAKKLRAKRPRPAVSTLAADVEAYLDGCTLASKKSHRSNLLAWVNRHPDTRRDRITHQHATAAVQAWSASRKPWTIRHRVQALRSLFRALDGPDAPTPVDGLVLGKKPRGRPVFVPAALIVSVAEGLARWPATLGRHLVLSTHGVRPCELMRATPADVSPDLWPVRTAKGGVSRVLHINTPAMQHAWQLFIKADAWGAYDTTLHARRLRKAGWPAGVRPYAVRGTWAMDLSRRGVSLRTIQELLGHANIGTTAMYYVAPEDSELADATKRTEGRFGVDSTGAPGLPTFAANIPTDVARNAPPKRTEVTKSGPFSHAPVAQLDRALASGAKGEPDPTA